MAQDAIWVAVGVCMFFSAKGRGSKSTPFLCYLLQYPTVWVLGGRLRPRRLSCLVSLSEPVPGHPTDEYAALFSDLEWDKWGTGLYGGGGS